jgi:hypothetical protein
MKKNILSAVLVVTTATAVLAQDAPKSLTKNKEISIVIGPTATQMKNSSLSNDEYVTIDTKGGTDFNFEFTKYIKNRLGFGIGIGYSSYKQAYSENGLFELLNQIDKDGDTYDRLVKANVNYTDKLGYANIPLSLNLLLGNSPRFYGFLNVGIVNQFLISGIHTKDGSVETMNRYPSQYYDVDLVMHNYPDYGAVYTPFSKKTTDRYKFYNMSIHLAVGLAASMTDRLMLKVQPFVNIGTSDITGTNDKGKDYENVLGQKSAYSKTSLSSAGLDVGFVFNID